MPDAVSRRESSLHRSSPAGALVLALLALLAVTVLAGAGTPSAEAAPPPRAQAIVSPRPPGDGVWVPTGRRQRGGRALLYRARLSFVQGQPWLTAALLRADLRRTRLHLSAGTVEPPSRSGVRGGGVIPQGSYRSLLASFNGGFKGAAGAFGFMSDGQLYTPPVAGLGTLLIWKRGGVKLGVYGRDITGLGGVAAMRQNLPLLVDGGRPAANAGSWWAWGATLGNVSSIWRSAVGVAANGDLIVGDAVSTPAQLARIMVAAGAVRALELDINPWWVHTFVYGPPAGDGTPVPQKLHPAMQRSSYRFLYPDTRDFFYLVASVPLAR